MPIRRTPLLERRSIQRKADPMGQPLPIDIDQFKTIRTADGQQIQSSQKVAELYYVERYGRKYTKDVWGIWFDFNAGAAVLLYGWNLPALPLKVELINGTDVDLWCNLTGTFVGPGMAPSNNQWNQAILTPPGYVNTVPDLGDINEDNQAQKFLEVFSDNFSTVGRNQVILYFTQPVAAPVQYSPP